MSSPRRFARLTDLIRREEVGGLALMAAAIAALIVANAPVGAFYRAMLAAPAGPLTIDEWIDDALMALFFLLVGLELKREMVAGRHRRLRHHALPLSAALCGMVVPALVYLAITASDPALARGWAVPVATDIAFSLGVIGLLGRRVPPALKLLLVTIAIADDLGAVLIIALGYTPDFRLVPLGAAVLIFGAMVGVGRRGVAGLAPYLALGILLWIATMQSGVHPTLAGVLTAFAIPAAVPEGRSPAFTLEHRLQPWVTWLVLPVFAFANAGVSLAGTTPAALLAPLPLGIAAGLFVGKQAGILGGLVLAVKVARVPLPAGVRWAHAYGLALLCGIGFTMSLFIGGLAFADPASMAKVKIGVLAGSILSAVAGYVVLRYASRRTAHAQAA